MTSSGRTQVRAYGAGGVLLEPPHPADVLALAAAARELDDVIEVVPAARTVLVVVRTPSALPAVVAALRTPVSTRLGPQSGDTVVLDVTYDGADLADTAALAGLDVDGVVRSHSGASYVVAFCGFAPGFAYLTGTDPVLHLPRLTEPRTRVPVGSVAIAGEFSGVYPRSSPGGWRLLGHTDAVLWDTERDPPALLTPGTRVQFRPT